MALNRFYSLLFFILLSKLSTSEVSTDKKQDSLYPKLLPQLQFNSKKVAYTNQTFSEPADIFDMQCTIKSCRFLNCYSEEIIEDHFGGAIYFTYCISTVADSLFDNCAASQGGAIFSQETKITITNTNFTNNLALEAGGAIVFYQCEDFKITGGFSMYNDAMYHGCFDVHESNGTIESHNFISNTAKVDCACVSVYESQVTISKCYFIENEAEIYPGALQIEEGDGMYLTMCNVKECYFISNEAGGEPINININGNVTGSITNCVFDIDIKEAILEFKAPLFKIENNKIDTNVKNPFKVLVENKQEVIEYSKVFDHTRSNYIAAVFLVLIPVYVGIVFLILIKD